MCQSSRDGWSLGRCSVSEVRKRLTGAREELHFSTIFTKCWSQLFDCSHIPIHEKQVGSANSRHARLMSNIVAL